MFFKKLFNRKSNKRVPLTLEELRNMNGCEIIVFCDDFPGREYRCKIIGDIAYCPFAAVFPITERYGESFIAYRVQKGDEIYVTGINNAGYV